MGPESIYVTAAVEGSPFFTSLLTISTDPHSHIGSAAPITEPVKIEGNNFFGIIFVINEEGMNSSTRPESIAPNTTKGNASISMARRMIMKLSTKD